MSEEKPIIKTSTPNSKKYDGKIDIYRGDPKGDHDSIHIAVDTDTKTAHIIDTTNGDTEHTDVSCYLTTACMKHFLSKFNDSCVELMFLRWFRDKFVSDIDIKYYYDVAPLIIEKIESSSENELIYNWIYEHIINPCVIAIQKGDYEFAYNRYKNSVLSLEQQFLSEKAKIKVK